MLKYIEVDDTGKIINRVYSERALTTTTVADLIEVPATMNLATVQYDPATKTCTSGPPDAAIQRLRLERNAKLQQTDWTQLADIPEVIASKYVTYRQALRDYPAAPPGTPWPTLPNN